MKKIAVFGATGMLGRPVTRELIEAGHEVTIVARDLAKATGFAGARIVLADLFEPSSVREALQDQDGVYLSLSISPGEKPDDRHTETDGLRNVIAAAQETGLRRIAMISSLVMNYQGQNGFHWWAFDLKLEAVGMLKDSGIPYTLFYPSSFMENFTHTQKRGNRIMLGGDSRFPMWFIAAGDYGKQVARSFQILDRESRDYPVQGPEPFTYEQAARVFAENYSAEKLKIFKAPLGLLKFLGIFSQTLSNGAKILEALNNYPEQFESERTWTDLGKPQITLAQFASQQGAR